MAAKPNDVRKAFHDKAQGPLDARMSRISTAAKVVEEAIDKCLKKADGKEFEDYFEVKVYFGADELAIVMSNDMVDLETILDLKYKLADWRAVTQKVFPVMANGFIKGYDLHYRIFKPVQPWQPPAGVDFTSIMRIGPRPTPVQSDPQLDEQRIQSLMRSAIDANKKQ